MLLFFIFVKMFFLSCFRESMWLQILRLASITSIVFGRPDRDVGHPCPGPPEKGPCNRSIYKWGYDRDSNQCILFIWGGCAGNDKNRFDTEIQCIRLCISLKCEYLYLPKLRKSTIFHLLKTNHFIRPMKRYPKRNEVLILLFRKLEIKPLLCLLNPILLFK